jgi:ABC-type taurine transport system substrate-binding protein
MDAAFNALRHHARSHNLKLTDVAAAVVRGDIDVAVLPPASNTVARERRQQPP